MAKTFKERIEEIEGGEKGREINIPKSQSPEETGKKAAAAPDASGNFTKRYLDACATGVVKKISVYELEEKKIIKDEKTGKETTIIEKVACVNSDGENKLNYGECGYSEDIVLMEAPLNEFVAEFEDKRETNEKHIRKAESACKALGIQYAIYDHGGKSEYLRIKFNGIPLSDDNKKAKLLLAQMLLPQEAVKQLDKTNLGFTLVPVPEHQHWKPKWKCAIHTLKRGKDLLSHDNQYPKELLKKLNDSKKRHKIVYAKTKKNTEWLIDFFFEYAANNKLPGGARHHVIEKNMAALLMEHPDWDLLKKKYLEAQGRDRDTFRTWEVAILNGEYKEPSAGEVFNYIKDNNIPYDIPESKDTPKKEISPDKVLEILKDKNILKKIHKEISKYHIHDDIEKTATFFFALTGYLQISEMHKTVNLLGDSSVGKDNMIKAILKMLPAEDWIFLTRGTTATLEDDIAAKKIIAFSELNTKSEDGANNAIAETLKQICEGGTSALKKDMISRQTKYVVQEQKAVLWGSTETKKDAELETRGTCITVLSDFNKTKAVNEKSCNDVSNMINMFMHAEKKESWTCDCIRYLNEKKRQIFAPFMPLMSDCFDSSNPRSQRDVKRFIALVLAITWLHQEQRPILKHEETEFVIATPIDMLLAFDIASPFLNQSYSGFDARFNAILDALKEKEMTRAEIQKLAHIGSVNTIRERIDILIDKGLVEYVWEEVIDNYGLYAKKHNEPKRINNSPVIRSLSVAYQKPIISLSVDEIKVRLKERITKEHLSSLSVDNNEIDRLLTGIRQAIDRYEKLSFDDKTEKDDKPINSPEGMAGSEKKDENKPEMPKNPEKIDDDHTFSKIDRLDLIGLKKPKKTIITPLDNIKKEYADVIATMDKIDIAGQGFEECDFVQEYQLMHSKTQREAEMRLTYAKPLLGLTQLKNKRWTWYK